MSTELRALTVVATARAEEQTHAHVEACRALERARTARDDATERCAMVEASLRAALSETGSSAAERAMSHACSGRWRERRAAARSLLAAAERKHAQALGAVEEARAALGGAHGERRVAESALERSEQAVRVARARRSEDEP